MKKYRAYIQYLGTNYAGWQIQSGQPTVQGLLTNALSHLAGEPVTVVGAGRTDAGVHALRQVAHFSFPERPSIKHLDRALNAHLPSDIRILRLVDAAPSFHARKDARRKRYDYRIFNGPVVPPLLYGRVTPVVSPLDVALMQEAAQRFLGTHDFSAFAGARTSARSRVRTVFSSRVFRRGRHVTFRIEGNGFLHHMVRNIAGTLIEIGTGRRSPDDISRLLAARNRRLAGPTAPPEGLYLVRVWYRAKS